MILGPTCAGKSTVAAILARRLGLTLVDLDAIHYVAGEVWREREMDEKRRLILRAADGERWVVDGYSNFMRGALLGRVTLALWIDLPARSVAPRIITRTLRRWIRREAVCGDNRERPWTLLTRDSLLLYLWQTRRSNPKKYAEAFDTFGASGAETVRFESTAEAIAWVISRGESRSPSR